MDDNIITFICLDDAGHMANSPDAIKLDLSLGKCFVTINPSNDLSGDA
jgi:hypothetical protein